MAKLEYQINDCEYSIHYKGRLISLVRINPDYRLNIETIARIHINDIIANKPHTSEENKAIRRIENPHPHINNVGADDNDY